jgi:hypothetical protein
MDRYSLPLQFVNPPMFTRPAFNHTFMKFGGLFSGSIGGMGLILRIRWHSCGVG